MWSGGGGEETLGAFAEEMIGRSGVQAGEGGRKNRNGRVLGYGSGRKRRRHLVAKREDR